MYLIASSVISEIRKKEKTDPGVRRFFAHIEAEDRPAYLPQTDCLAAWLHTIVTEYRDCLLSLNEGSAQICGRLRVAHHEHALDKQVAATALIHGLTVAIRNVDDFARTGVPVINPFAAT